MAPTPRGIVVEVLRLRLVALSTIVAGATKLGHADGDRFCRLGARIHAPRNTPRAIA
jgi:hypothetical protein